jgi:hypothetical protein
VRQGHDIFYSSLPSFPDLERGVNLPTRSTAEGEERVDLYVSSPFISSCRIMRDLSVYRITFTLKELLCDVQGEHKNTP